MNCKFKHVWILTSLVAGVMKTVNVQFAMPMYPPMFPPPPPPMYPMPIIAQIQYNITYNTTSNKATSTTTKRPEAIDAVDMAVPMAMPMPMPIPMPMPMPMPMPVPNFALPNIVQGSSPRPANCPPCPPCACSPSCTPAIFSYCSPCHQKCRCRNKEDTPEPLPNRPAQCMPVPMPAVLGPPPLVMVPYPPPMPIQQKIYRPKKERKPKYLSSSEDSSEMSSSDSDYIRRRRYKKRKRYGGFRRSLRSSDSENELVKPMLSYVAENGDVKFNTKINGDDVAELLGENDNKYQAVQVATREDENNRRNAVVLSKKDEKQKRYKKVLLREGVSNHFLENGKKEIVFKPGYKKISNLSVSFQLS